MKRFLSTILLLWYHFAIFVAAQPTFEQLPDSRLVPHPGNSQQFALLTNGRGVALVLWGGDPDTDVNAAEQRVALIWNDGNFEKFTFDEAVGSNAIPSRWKGTATGSCSVGSVGYFYLHLKEGTMSIIRIEYSTNNGGEVVVAWNGDISLFSAVEASYYRFDAHIVNIPVPQSGVSDETQCLIVGGRPGRSYTPSVRDATNVAWQNIIGLHLKVSDDNMQGNIDIQRQVEEPQGLGLRMIVESSAVTSDSDVYLAGYVQGVRRCHLVRREGVSVQNEVNRFKFTELESKPCKYAPKVRANSLHYIPGKNLLFWHVRGEESSQASLLFIYSTTLRASLIRTVMLQQASEMQMMTVSDLVARKAKYFMMCGGQLSMLNQCLVFNLDNIMADYDVIPNPISQRGGTWTSFGSILMTWGGVVNASPTEMLSLYRIAANKGDNTMVPTMTSGRQEGSDRPSPTTDTQTRPTGNRNSNVQSSVNTNMPPIGGTTNIREPTPEILFGDGGGGSPSQNSSVLIGVIVAVVALLLVCSIGAMLWLRKRKGRNDEADNSQSAAQIKMKEDNADDYTVVAPEKLYGGFVESQNYALAPEPDRDSNYLDSSSRKEEQKKY